MTRLLLDIDFEIVKAKS